MAGVSKDEDGPARLVLVSSPSFPSEVDVAVIGGGAAGIGAGLRLKQAGVSFLIIEARNRLGGRAWSVDTGFGFPVDLGCGWLHSADLNPWSAIAEASGFTIDRTPAPWSTRAAPLGFTREEWLDYRAAADAFYDRVSEAAKARERPASDLLEPGGRWNGLIGAVSTYANGVELEGLSVVDYARYFDNGTNWRLPDGYGAMIVAQAKDLPVVLDCAVSAVDHSGPRISLQTAKGTIRAGAVIVTVPTNLIAAETIRFTPALPEKVAAAGGLPLGLADKIYLKVEKPNSFSAGARVFGDRDKVASGSYHLRPFARPVIEGYFGGALARELEKGGEKAFAARAIDELSQHLGSSIRKHLKPIVATAWERDPLARGSYTHARVGHADDRAVLAAPVNERLFFAGEACSPANFSTAHGAYESGVVAAEGAVAPLKSSGGI